MERKLKRTGDSGLIFYDSEFSTHCPYRCLCASQCGEGWRGVDRYEMRGLALTVDCVRMQMLEVLGRAGVN